MDSLSPQELLFDSCTSITHSPSYFQLGLLPQSKRIRKVKHSLYSAQTSPSFADSPHDTEDSDDTTLLASRYCVFPAEEKKKILNDLKEFMTQTLDIEIIDETHDWRASFEKLEEKDFILFIQRELPNYKPELDINSRKVHLQFKKSISRWLKSEGAPERSTVFNCEISNNLGGDPLIPQKDFPRFKKIVLQIIKDLENRNLETLRKRILPHVEAIRKENNLSFKDNMFQKHKWCKFLQQNPDIKALWVQLPRSKCTNKGSRQKENIHQEELSYQDSPENISDDFSFINELNQIQDNFSVSEAHFPNEEFENNQAKTEFLENIEESSFAFDVSTPTELNVDDQEEDFTDSFWKEWKERSFKYSQATPF